MGFAAFSHTVKLEDENERAGYYTVRNVSFRTKTFAVSSYAADHMPDRLEALEKVPLVNFFQYWNSKVSNGNRSGPVCLEAPGSCSMSFQVHMLHICIYLYIVIMIFHIVILLLVLSVYSAHNIYCMSVLGKGSPTLIQIKHLKIEAVVCCTDC